ncbi:MAG: reverse gyrase [Desulfurococcales archaeon]|nr:reverse gyrase [Desulfurococcales archaeon]
MPVEPVYRWACPNCGGPIEASRLARGLPCRACLPEEPGEASVEAVAAALEARGALRGYLWLRELWREYGEFEAYFESKTGSGLWSAQRSWARRLLALDSIEIVAPTGVGKTTLLSVYAAFRAERDGWRVLYLVPTENLVAQTAARLEGLAPGLVVSYRSSGGRMARLEALGRIERGDFRVAVVTTGFLQRRFELLARHAPYDLVIVDDVDSLLRGSRNVERVLALLGYPEEAVAAALELVEARVKLYAALAAGREERAGRLQERIAELESRLRSLAPEPMGQLVIASATGRPRGLKHLVFRELLGFEVGGGSDYMRNVVDSYTITGDIAGEVARLAKRLGRGGIVFVSQSLGRAWARALVERLNREGVRAAAALAGSRRAVERLARGEVDVVVGVASRYGVVVRGIDLPEVVRYAIFAGAPARRLDAGEALLSPGRLLRLLLALADEGDRHAAALADRLRRALDRLPDPSLAGLAARGRIDAGEGPLAEAAAALLEAREYALARLAERLAGGGVEYLGGTVYSMEAGGLYAYIVDAPTYLQASGRTSRLLRGAMTLGLSVVVESRAEMVRALEDKLRWYARARFEPLERLDLDSLLEAVEESRRGGGRRVRVRTVLLVVESPTKARTIAWFWGRPGKRRVAGLTVYETAAYDEEEGAVYLLTITATRGHIYDLAVDEEGSIHGVRVEGGLYKPVYTTVKRCLSCGYQFTDESSVCPRCGSAAVVDSRRVVEALRKLATEVDEVIVATDPDREGEKIGWDVALAVAPFNRNVRRGRFHEVTREAVMEALRGAGGFDERLVEAQLVRRVVDRWVGFTLSGHLRERYGRPWLGAGRVQTPVLGWIVERYRQWEEGRGYRVYARLRGGGRLSLYTRSPEEAREAAASPWALVVEASYWEAARQPPPPYTTDSLLYDASRRLGLPAGLTMRLAQDLFESGLITYHRTDSTRVSPAGMGVARAYLEKRGLGGLYRPRQWGEGGAHEAIRPTRPLDAGELERAVLEGSLRVPIRLTRLHLRLYQMIFERFIASQMAEARVVMGRVTLRLARLEQTLERPVKAVDPGFMAVYQGDLAGWLCCLKPGDRLEVEEARLARGSSVSLLRSGDVVRLMKEHGIGRPSTYAKAVEANKRHGYVVESKRRSYLIPTRRGREVYSYLSTSFPELVSVEATRELEETLDKVAEGVLPADQALERAWAEIESLLARAAGEPAGPGEGVAGAA